MAPLSAISLRSLQNRFRHTTLASITRNRGKVAVLMVHVSRTRDAEKCIQRLASLSETECDSGYKFVVILCFDEGLGASPIPQDQINACRTVHFYHCTVGWARCKTVGQPRGPWYVVFDGVGSSPAVSLTMSRKRFVRLQHEVEFNNDVKSMHCFAECCCFGSGIKG